MRKLILKIIDPGANKTYTLTKTFKLASLESEFLGSVNRKLYCITFVINVIRTQENCLQLLCCSIIILETDAMNINSIWFQQDYVPLYYVQNVSHYLSCLFSHPWIERELNYQIPQIFHQMISFCEIT